jgi:hypothetical protein
MNLSNDELAELRQSTESREGQSGSMEEIHDCRNIVRALDELSNFRAQAEPHPARPNMPLHAATSQKPLGSQRTTRCWRTASIHYVS